MKKVMLVICLFAVIAILSGCVNWEKRMINAGYSPDYSKGWAEGRESASAAECIVGNYWKKNVYMYDNNSQYNQGWNDGFAAGRANNESIRGVLNSSR